MGIFPTTVDFRLGLHGLLSPIIIPRMAFDFFSLLSTQYHDMPNQTTMNPDLEMKLIGPRHSFVPTARCRNHRPWQNSEAHDELGFDS
jgi:hypothetical protein